MTQYETATLGAPSSTYKDPLTFNIYYRGKIGDAHAYSGRGSIDYFVAWFASEEVHAQCRARTIDVRAAMTHPDTIGFTFQRVATEPCDGTIRLTPMDEPFIERMIPPSGYYYGDL